jgi:hypothetical protein
METDPKGQGAWRSGFAEPSWHHDPTVEHCRSESLRAYKALRELMVGGVPEQPSVEQAAARERALYADAAYEAAKWDAIRADASNWPRVTKR